MADGLLHCQSLVDVSAHEAFDNILGLVAEGLICVAAPLELGSLDRLVQILYPNT